MNLTESEKEKIGTLVYNGLMKPCYECGNANFEISDKNFQLISFVENQGNLDMSQPFDLLRVVTMVCTNCGAIKLFHLNSLLAK